MVGRHGCPHGCELTSDLEAKVLLLPRIKTRFSTLANCAVYIAQLPVNLRPAPDKLLIMTWEMTLILCGDGGRWPRNSLHLCDNRGQRLLEVLVAVALQHGKFDMFG
jgi:hypothetical protein